MLDLKLVLDRVWGDELLLFDKLIVAEIRQIQVSLKQARTYCLKQLVTQKTHLSFLLTI